MDSRSEEAIAESIVRDVVEGADGTDIRAGIVGEVGCSSPMQPNEAKSLRASARAQRRTGVPISIHPGRDAESPFEILDILEKAGADPTRVVMGHMERGGLDRGRLVELARRGCYLEYDWFGEVRPTWPFGRVDVPSDGERIKTIAFLIAEGFVDRVLVSHDVCFKTRLASYGGPGYAHIVKYVWHWMKALGLTSEQIDTIMVKNPKRVLQFA
jgi:phosphotriesterase-related protein